MNSVKYIEQERLSHCYKEISSVLIQSMVVDLPEQH